MDTREMEKAWLVGGGRGGLSFSNNHAATGDKMARVYNAEGNCWSHDYIPADALTNCST